MATWRGQCGSATGRRGPIDGNGGAHGQAILECCRLGLDGGRVVRCREPSPGRQRKPSSAATKALRQVQSESPGRHGGGCEGGGGVENEWFEGNLERAGSSLQKTMVCSVILPHFPGQLGNARAKQALAVNSSRHVAAALCSASFSWQFWNFGLFDWLCGLSPASSSRQLAP